MALKFRPTWWPRLKQLGYDVIPLFDKEHPHTGWPKQPNDEAAIEQWGGAGAAIRMYRSNLLVIDLDVHLEVARDRMLAWMTEHHPEFMAGCLRRHSGAISIALIGRTVTAKRTQKIARYIGEGTDPRGDFVEVFTGNSKKYVGVAGRHSAGREYDYHGRHILDTPVDDLPWLADSAIAPMLAAFEEIMVGCGWEKVIPTSGKEASGSKVYFLEKAMIFTLTCGEKVKLEDLERDFEGYVIASQRDGGSGKITGYADLWDPATGASQHSKTRVIVTKGREGLGLYDTKHEVRYRWKHREPPKTHAEFTAALRELMNTMRQPKETRP